MLANQRMTNPPKCRGTTQPCNESSSPSWWKPAASTSRSKPLTTTKGLAKGWSRRSSLPSSNAARRAAPTSYGRTKAPSPMTVNHTRSNPPQTKDSPLCVIVVELHPRRSNSDFTSPGLAPPTRQPPRGGGRPSKITNKATMTSRCDAFKKGTTSKTPSSHVQKGQGSHPWRKM